MPERLERQMEEYLRGDLSLAEARSLAQTALDRPELFEELTFAAVATRGLAAQPISDPLELYVSGRLPAHAHRELAQAALADDELFDALVAHAAVEQGFESPKAVRKIVRFPRRTWAVAITAMAAALVGIAIYLRPPAHQTIATTAVHASAASLDPAAGKPILLARDLSPISTPGGAAPVFRSSEAASRAPRPEGSIVAVDNFIVTVNLGSLDGLAKGTRLEVFRGNQSVGTLEVDTIFRDRARGRILSGRSIQAGDIVRAAPSVYLGAVLEQMNADPANARKLGRAAVAATSAAPAETRKILERLAQLDYESGDIKSAEQDYQTIIKSFNSPPEALTNLGVLYLLQGDTTQAEANLRGLHDPQSLNNLAIAAELRGDATSAQALYREALQANPTPRDRQTIEANLARLAGAAHEPR